MSDGAARHNTAALALGCVTSHHNISDFLRGFEIFICFTDKGHGYF